MGGKRNHNRRERKQKPPSIIPPRRILPPERIKELTSLSLISSKNTRTILSFSPYFIQESVREEDVQRSRSFHDRGILLVFDDPTKITREKTRIAAD